MIRLRGTDIQDAIGEGVVVVMFAAGMSERSHNLERLLGEEISAKFGGKINYYVVDIDEETEIAKKYGINIIPTVGLFKDAEPKVKIEGLHEKDVYIQQILNLMK